MYNETEADKIIRKLRQVTFETVHEIFKQENLSDAMLRQYGWTIEEYGSELSRRVMRNQSAILKAKLIQRMSSP